MRRLLWRVGRWLLCHLGSHEWAPHSDHLHFSLGPRIWSVVETQCVWCSAIKLDERVLNDASPAEARPAPSRSTDKPIG